MEPLNALAETVRCMRRVVFVFESSRDTFSLERATYTHGSF